MSQLLLSLHLQEEGVCRNVMQKEILPNITTAHDPQKSVLQNTIFYQYRHSLKYEIEYHFEKKKNNPQHI